jgi:hypothetical protein
MRSTLALAVALATTAVPASALAAPIIGNTTLHTDNRSALPGNPLPDLRTGYLLLVTAAASPSGAGTTVQAVQPGGPGAPIPMTFGPLPGLPNNYYALPDYAGQSGQWTIQATDASGTATGLTHVLDDVRQLPILSGVAVSGPYITPRISWNAVDAALYPSSCTDCPIGFDFFNYSVEVRAFAGNGPVVYAGPAIPTAGPSFRNYFDIPAGVLADGTSYIFGVKLVHSELEAKFTDPATGQIRFFSPVENRSTAFVAHQPVPEPSTFALMGAGVLLLASIVRRRT